MPAQLITCHICHQEIPEGSNTVSILDISTDTMVHVCETCDSNNSDIHNCARCGGRFLGNPEVVYPGTGEDTEYWCNICKREHAHRCPECGEYAPNDTFRSVIGSDNTRIEWCGYCAENSATECPHCGVPMSDGAPHISIAGEGDWCVECADRHACTCYHCGEHFSSQDTSMTIDNHGHQYCPGCAQDVLTYCNDIEGYAPSVDTTVRRNTISGNFESCISNREDDYTCVMCGDEFRGPGFEGEDDDGNTGIVCPECYHDSCGFDEVGYIHNAGITIERVGYRDWLGSHYANAIRDGSLRLRFTASSPARPTVTTETISTTTDTPIEWFSLDTTATAQTAQQEEQVPLPPRLLSSDIPLSIRFSKRLLSVEVETGGVTSNSVWHEYGCKLSEANANPEIMSRLFGQWPYSAKTDGSLENGARELLISKVQAGLVEPAIEFLWDMLKSLKIPIESFRAGHHMHIDARDIYKFIVNNSTSNSEKRVTGTNLFKAFLSDNMNLIRFYVSRARFTSVYCSGGVATRGGHGGPSGIATYVGSRDYPTIAIRTETVEFRLWPSSDSVANTLARAELSQRIIDKAMWFMRSRENRDKWNATIKPLLDQIRNDCEIRLDPTDFYVANLGLTEESAAVLRNIYQRYSVNSRTKNSRPLSDGNYTTDDHLRMIDKRTMNFAHSVEDPSDHPGFILLDTTFTVPCESSRAGSLLVFDEDQQVIERMTTRGL